MATEEKRATILSKLRTSVSNLFFFEEPLAKNYRPYKAHDVIEYAKKHRDTMKDRAIAVGPRFDEGMSRLDEFEKVVEQYEDKPMTNELLRDWGKSFKTMFYEGLGDVIHTVGSLKPHEGDNA